MKRFVPLEKQSKKQRRAYYAARRRGWGDVNPVTRTSKNPKAYRRRKSRTWEEDDSTGRDFCCFVRLLPWAEATMQPICRMGH